MLRASRHCAGWAARRGSFRSFSTSPASIGTLYTAPGTPSPDTVHVRPLTNRMGAACRLQRSAWCSPPTSTKKGPGAMLVVVVVLALVLVLLVLLVVVAVVVVLVVVLVLVSVVLVLVLLLVV